ncbi:Na/Pi symporter [Algoriphagus sp. CAU 1675]|uniref:Na/Pi cotransporter family protein n=1 Tax=Algoriphagus sp. CAU 1675 TaxID=3032597 RepID=UPI0023DC851C|nr:Na/Pi symporter [Algoriphagus sp. CAU 1675]MDF2158476.1 Na/Pi symporter [Algoriphagus sp. CAU 1675]
MTNFSFWEFLAGLGIFLLGMSQMESGLKELAGKSFRNLLRKFTSQTWKGILTGIMITAVLQSSSLVTLMVLAFLGAGLINLKNSIGVILGTNLGTTVTSWLVLTVGFKVSIAAFAFPLVAFGALVSILLKNRPSIKNTGVLILGFGFLFYGLDLMKNSISDLATQFELSSLSGLNILVFLLIGVLLTALIQSSSATTVILLSALNSNILGLEQAAAATIGANIGTTITVIMGAIGGTPDKKRLALVHFLFNLITASLILPFLTPLIDWASSGWGKNDPLTTLALFNTSFNLIGVLLFLPLTGILEKNVKKRFVSKDEKISTVYIHKVDINVPEAAIKALENELAIVYEKTKVFIENVLGIKKEKVNQYSLWDKFLGQPFEMIRNYNEIKILEDEITEYHIRLQGAKISEIEAKKVTSLMLSLRLMIFAAKAFKDIYHNLQAMKEAERGLPQRLLSDIQKISKTYLKEIDRMKNQPDSPDDFPAWIKNMELKSDKMIEEMFGEAKSHKTDIPFSTLTNVIKEFLRGLQNLGASVIHWRHPINEVLDYSNNSKNPYEN